MNELTAACIIQYARRKSIADALCTCSEGGDKCEDVVNKNKTQNKKGRRRHFNQKLLIKFPNLALITGIKLYKWQCPTAQM